MPISKPTAYRPDYGTKPGEVLADYLAKAGMTKADLATRCGRPMKTISEIIHGKAAITPETALQLERVLGHPAAFWQNLEAAYRLHLAIEGESDDLASHINWAKGFPIRELVARGDIEHGERPADLVRNVLRFFGVGSVAGWQAEFGTHSVAFRRSPAFKQTPESVAAWIRLGEIAAEKILCAPYDRTRFKRALDGVRALTVKQFSRARPKAVELCAAAGVAVAFVPELPKTHLSGAARWLTKDKALIQLSMRHKTNDHVWFSFFHEAGHILLHGKKTIFIDETGQDVDDIEAEANEFAADLLIPPDKFRMFATAKDFSADAIRRFAAEQEIAAGIVVGRLQHEEFLHHSVHRDLKETVR